MLEFSLIWIFPFSILFFILGAVWMYLRFARLPFWIECMWIPLGGLMYVGALFIILRILLSRMWESL